MIVKLFLCLFWLIIVPYILGKFLINEEENEILYSWILGHFFQMAIFFVIAIPMILLKQSFMNLVYIYSVTIIIFSLISVIVNRKKFVFKRVLEKFKVISVKDIFKKISLYQIIFLVIFGTFLGVRFRYASINDDDSSFVGLSTEMIETDKMYLTKDSNGEYTKLVARRALAPSSAYYSALSKQLQIHVTIVTHTIIQMMFICIGFIIYDYFSKAVFEKKDSRYIFLIFIFLLSIYTFEVKGYNKYFLLYTWFGRAIMAGVILPAIWKISIDSMNKEKNKIRDWITTFVLVNAGCLCTEMSVALIPISLCSLAIVNGIRDRKISYLFKSILCIIPCAIIGYIYLKIK